VYLDIKVSNVRYYSLTHRVPIERPNEHEETAKSNGAQVISTSSHVASYARHFITTCVTLTQYMSHTHYHLKEFASITSIFSTIHSFQLLKLEQESQTLCRFLLTPNLSTILNDNNISLNNFACNFRKSCNKQIIVPGL
jgi:hypothetical protein